MNTLRLGTPPCDRPGIDRVVVYVSDRGYIAQALVSAAQLAAQPEVTAIADIIIFLVDVPEGEQAEILAALGGAHFNFRFLDSRQFMTGSTDRLPELHCPLSSLGRLVIDAEIPAQYRTVIYIDGDTQVVGPAAPLIGMACEPGVIYAAADRLDNGGKYANSPAYLASIGVDQVASYFNAGVMVAERSTWRQLTAEALQFLAANPEKCKHYDQSALNAVAVGKVRMLSPAYNYSSWFWTTDETRAIRPSIVHFTGPIKPWNATRRPWGESFRQVYSEFLRENPFFARYLKIDASKDVDPKYARPTPVLRARLAAKVLKQKLEHRYHRHLWRHYLREAPFLRLG